MTYSAYTGGLDDKQRADFDRQLERTVVLDDVATADRRERLGAMYAAEAEKRARHGGAPAPAPTPHATDVREGAEGIAGIMGAFGLKPR